MLRYFSVGDIWYDIEDSEPIVIISYDIDWVCFIKSKSGKNDFMIADAFLLKHYPANTDRF
jgi:hypothetical protein